MTHFLILETVFREQDLKEDEVFTGTVAQHSCFIAESLVESLLGHTLQELAGYELEAQVSQLNTLPCFDLLGLFSTLVVAFQQDIYFQDLKVSETNLAVDLRL